MSLNAMNFAESSGESSSSGRENGAASSDTDRPYKKARFPWQIKGKHHLKNQADSQTDTPANAPEELGPATPPSEPATPPSEPDTPPPEMVVPSNKASLGKEGQTKRENCFICTGPGGAKRHGHGEVCCQTDSKRCLPIEAVITLAESLLQLSSYDRSNNYSPERNDLKLNPEKELKPDPSPSDPVTARKMEEETCISKWQTDQIVNGTFDNNINYVLESCLYDTEPTDDISRIQDIAMILNDFPLNLNNDNVENEAIQMAINAHGLQNVPSSESYATFSLIGSVVSTLARDIRDDGDSSISTENLEIFNDWASNGPLAQHEHRNSNQPEPYPVHDSSNQEFEFLNTAVIQAIKNKGLMASGSNFV